MGRAFIGNIKGPQGPQGPEGKQGLPGLNGVPTDEAVAVNVRDRATDTGTAVGRAIDMAGADTFRSTAASFAPRVGAGAPRSTGGTLYTGVPGAQIASVQTLAVPTLIRRYNAFELTEPTRITDLSFEVTTGPGGATSVIAGIYAADQDFQPVDRQASVSVAVAAGFTGVKTAAMPVTLQPGRYLMAVQVGAAMTLRSMRGGVSHLAPALGATPVPAAFTVTATFEDGLLPEGVRWTGVAAGTAPEHVIALSWAPVITPRASHFLLPNATLVKGMNLTVKATTNWGHFWGSGWDWDGWVKWQIDLAHSAGANTIRVLGAISHLFSGRQGYYAGSTLAAYRARWRQIIDYCASLGMYTYASGGNVSTSSDTDGLTVADVQGVLVGVATEIGNDPWVLGMDVIQENYAWASANAATVIPAIRAVCSRPLTFSIPAASGTLANNFNSTYAQGVLRPWVDFYDYHVYFDFAATDVDYFFAKNSKPVLFGEYGRAVADGNPAYQTRAAVVRGMLARVTGDGKHVAGALVWAVTDQSTDPANQWGVWQTDGTPRTVQLGEFTKLPTRR